MLRTEIKSLETELYMPAADHTGAMAKEFITGKIHGLRMMEFRMNDSVKKLQENVRKQPKQ